MTIFAAIRNLTYLARDFHAFAQHVLTPRLLDGADELAEQEAQVDVSEPWGECDCDCGLGEESSVWDLDAGLIPAVPLIAPLTADEVLAVRQLLAERTQSPVASASPPTPADATGPTLGNDPYAVHERHMRRLLGEDRGGS